MLLVCFFLKDPGNTTVLTSSLGSLMERQKPGEDHHECISSSPAEEDQILSTYHDVQMPEAGDLTRGSDFRMPSATDKSLDGEPSVIHNHIQKERIPGHKGSGAYEVWNDSIENSSSPAPRQQVEVDGASILDEPQVTGVHVIGKFEEILGSLRSVALTRDEAQKVENLLWDVKGELYAAEKRGREAS